MDKYTAAGTNDITNLSTIFIFMLEVTKVVLKGNFVF